MLLRDAQEEARVVYSARQNTSNEGVNLLQFHLSEVTSSLEEIHSADHLEWKGIVPLVGGTR